VSKRACENYIEAYHERYGLSYSILRYGSLYGPRADERNAIYCFIKQALEEGRINYGGRPEAVREYIHVEDAARLSVEILQPQYANRHLTLTGHERMTVQELLKMVAEMLPGKVAVEFSEAPEDDSHYVMTPYSFNPRLGHKLFSRDHVDIGQGLLNCMAEIHGRKHPEIQAP
jgi:UDP-glucose 4-epimerase